MVVLGMVVLNAVINVLNPSVANMYFLFTETVL